MKNLRSTLLALAALVVVLSAIGSAQTIALVGVVRNGSGGPVAGASVFVQRVTDPSGAAASGKEVGPVTTSNVGTFSFYNLPPGVYAVRIVIAGKDVWIGRTRVPGNLAPIVLH